MHIPEGFVSPQTFVPAAIIDLIVWWAITHNIRENFNEMILPFLSVSGAMLFVLSSIMIPIPGGTSIHLSGIGIAVALFGLRYSILLFSIVLLVQALLFGQGGLSTFFTNSFAIAIIGSVSAWSILHFMKQDSKVTFFLMGVVGVLGAALTTAIILGIQPLIATDENGQPLYFPFGLSIVIPAVILPHLLVAVIEGVITALVVPKLKKSRFIKNNLN